MFGANLGAASLNILGGEDIATNHTWLPDGQVLLAGGGYDINCNCMHISLVKMDTVCGKLDASFGNAGSIGHIFDGRSILRDMVVLPNGKILACGQNAPDNSLSQQVGAVYRFNADGTADLTMNGTGWRTDRFDALSSGLHSAIIPLNGGRFYAAGTSGANINGGFFGLGLMRFLENGSLDASYSGDGKTWTNLGGEPYQPTVHDALLLADSSVLVIGSVAPVFGQPREMLLVRFDMNGNLFSGFGNGGYALPGIRIYEGVPQHRGELLADGSILVGCTAQNPEFRYVTFRVTADGTLDGTYGTGGISAVDPGAGNEFAYGLFVGSDGASYQFGNRDNQISYIVKRDAQGQVVPTFGTNGIYTVPQLIADMGVRGGLPLENGRVLLYGRANANDMVMVKLTPDPSAGLFADAGADRGFCPGESVELDAGSEGATYQWFRATTAVGTTQTITVNTAGSYRVHITDAQGCTDRDTVVVSAYLAPPIPLIEQFEDMLYSFVFGDIQWFVDNEPISGATTEELTITQNGSYTVMVTDPSNGCAVVSPPYMVLNVGVTERDGSSQGLALVPMPVDARTELRFTLATATMVEVYAIDAVGRSVIGPLKAGVLQPGAHTMALSELDALAPGNYHLCVHYGTERSVLHFVR